MSPKILSLSGAFAVLLCAGPALASQPDSTPAEQAQTQQLNQGVSNSNAVADAQNTEKSAVYQAQVDRYQAQLKVYRANQTDYHERAAAYLAARDRYVAAHARFHRGMWPASYDQRLIVDTNDLLGANVATVHGKVVGHVVEIALVSGHVSALRVSLDNQAADVWVEAPDLRFDADKKLVMTNLDRNDLYEMSHDTY
jgi:hypothetical protein